MKTLLRNLFNRNPKLRDLIMAMISSSKEAIAIYDHQGDLIFGNGYLNQQTPKEIYLNGLSIGSVYGGSAAFQICDVIQLFVDQQDIQKKLGAETLQMYREINLLFAFAGKLSQITDVESIAQLAIEEVENVIQFERGVIFLGENIKDIKVLANKSIDKIDQWLSEQIFNKDSKIFNLNFKNDNYTILISPLKINSKILGQFILLRNIGQEFTASDLKLLTSLALQTGAALENALHYQAYLKKELELREEKIERETLRTLNDLKSQFFSNLAHEFRTPLSIILGVADQKNTLHHVNDQERLSMIHRNVSSLFHLVDQMLELAKLDEINIPVHYTACDVVPFFKQILEPFRLLATEKKISLRFQDTMHSFFAEIDTDKVHKIVANLISNALKFTGESGEIILSCHYKSAPESSLLISVSDNGLGISSKHLDHIFDRFYQIREHNNLPVNGFGIGLSYAHKLAQLMNGEIVVESELDKGSTFTLRLPIDETIPVQWIPVQKKSDENPTSGDGLPSVLLIEDNKDMQTFLRSGIAQQYQIYTASDGASGINLARELIPDIIITDLMLPVLDGHQVCQRLKSDELTNHIPIVMLTAFSDQTSRLEGLRGGADIFLTKPIDLAELKIRLKMLLINRRKYHEHVQSMLKNGIVSSEDDLSAPENHFIKKVSAILDENLADENFGLMELCKSIGMSRSQLFRKLKALMNQSPSTFIRLYRLGKAKDLLLKTDLPVSQIAYRVGFKDPAYFSFAFHEAFGSTPSAVR